jgi:hypothetical protein
MGFIDDSLKFVQSQAKQPGTVAVATKDAPQPSVAVKPVSFIDESLNFKKTGKNPAAIAAEAAKQTEVDPGLYTKLRERGASTFDISKNLAPKKVSALDVADETSAKFLGVLATPFQLLSSAIQGVEKGIGGGSAYAAQEINNDISDLSGGKVNLLPRENKTLGQYYDNAPTAGGMTSETLLDITKWAHGKQDKPLTTIDFFMPEFIGQIADAGLEAAILAPIGSRIATEYKTVKVTPEQMVDVMTGRTPVGEPLPPETMKLVKTELLKPETAKTIIKEATQKGVEFKVAQPAAGPRQAVGEFLGGSPESKTTKVSVGGRDVATTPFQSLSQPELGLPGGTTVKAEPNIPKELQPLVEEAKKYKSVDEFVKNVTKKDFGDLVTQPSDLRFGQITPDDVVRPSVKLPFNVDAFVARDGDLFTVIEKKTGQVIGKGSRLTKGNEAGIKAAIIDATNALKNEGEQKALQGIAEARKAPTDGFYRYWNRIPDEQLTNFYNQVSEQTQSAVVKTTPFQSLSQDAEIVRPLKPIGTGETKVSKLASGVEEKAIENKLAKSFDDLPQYQQLNMKEQAQKSVELLNSDNARAIRIALGQEMPPADIIPESVFAAVEEYATQKSDIDLLRQLATSELTSEATAMGQRIRALAERNPDSAVAVMDDVVKTREKAAGKKLKGKTTKEARKETVAEIEKEIKQFTPREKDWAAFIEKIKCNY